MPNLKDTRTSAPLRAIVSGDPRSSPRQPVVPVLDLDLKVFDEAAYERVISEVARTGRMKPLVTAPNDRRKVMASLDRAAMFLKMEFALRRAPLDGEVRRALTVVRSSARKLVDAFPVIDPGDGFLAGSPEVSNSVADRLVRDLALSLDEEVSTRAKTERGVTLHDLYGALDAKGALVMLSNLARHLERAADAALSAPREEASRETPLQSYCESLIPIYERLFGTRASGSESNSKPKGAQDVSGGPTIRFLMACIACADDAGLVPPHADLPTDATVARWIKSYNRTRSSRPAGGQTG